MQQPEQVEVLHEVVDGSEPHETTANNPTIENTTIAARIPGLSVVQIEIGTITPQELSFLFCSDSSRSFSLMKRGAAARRVLNSIAANVRAERLQKHWSQLQLAEAADLSARYVVEIERGIVDVGSVALSSLAEALGIDPGALFREAKKEPARPAGRPRGVVEQRTRHRVTRNR